MCSMPMLSRIISGIDAGVALLFGGHLAMSGRSRMAGQRLGIAQIDQPLDQLQSVVEFDCGIVAALDADGHQRACAAAKIFLRQRMVGAVGKAGVIDPLDPGVVRAETRLPFGHFRHGARPATRRFRFPAAAEMRSAATRQPPSSAGRRCGSVR